MKNADPSTLYLVDASSFIFRAFFAIRKLSTSKGLPTNAIYGFSTMLLNLIESQKAKNLVCVFDTAAPTHRKKIYDEYKANRGAPPDDLIPQFEYIYKVVDALGIKTLFQAGYEADDIIATLCKKFHKSKIVIVTGDKDLMQLVNSQVTILDTMKNVVYDSAGVKTKLGVLPEFVTDYLGLIGDSSDNIPGVPGIGPKSAVDLIQEYGHLEDILKAVPKMKEGKKKVLLQEHSKQALLSKQLATVDTAVEGCCDNLTLNDFLFPQEIPAAFIDLARELELNSIVKKYQNVEVEVVSQETQEQLGLQVESEADWKKCLSVISQSDYVGLDCQIDGILTTEMKPVGMGLVCAGEKHFYIPLQKLNQNFQNKILEDIISSAPLFVGYDLKQFYKILYSQDLILQNSWQGFDVMLAHYLNHPDEKHELDILTQRYLEKPIHSFSRTQAMFELYKPLSAELKKNEMLKLFNEIEMPVAQVLAEMEWHGVKLDSKILTELSREYEVELKEIEKEIYSTVGYTFNLNSPKQLSEALFVKLGLPVIQKTKTGYSTDVRVLEKLSSMHSVPAHIVRYRELTKLKSTYVDVLPGLIEKDGRVHAKFNQAVAATGRLSGSDPNLQNIPIKTESGRKIRKAFIAEKNSGLVGSDYSQIELRLVAHMSEDQALISAFQNNQDVHQTTAAEIFNVDAKDVTSEQRSAAKAINFGLIYGKTAFGLSQELNISRKEAQDYIDAYFRRYKGVKKFMDQCLEEAKQNHYSKTLFGRRRPIQDLDNKNIGVRQNAERIAFNAPVQGTAADIMKLAMIHSARTCKSKNYKLILQVHDELVLEVPSEEIDDAKKSLAKDMQQAAQLKVPLDVSSASGKTWFDL